MTRDEAAQAGATTFITGKPCRNGHTADRYVLNYTCVMCMRISNARSGAKHVHKISAVRKIRYATDENYRLRRLACAHLRKLLLGVKPGKITDEVGCDTRFIRKYLETKFYADMSWTNYGVVWEIDHIKPLCSFDLTDPSSRVSACHWSNLRPLTRQENSEKTKTDIACRL